MIWGFIANCLNFPVERVQSVLRATFGGMEKQLTEARLAQAFAEEHRQVLCWRKRHHGAGQPFAWYYEGRLDEYAIEARKLALDWLANFTRQDHGHIPTDAINEQAFRLLELAKETLTMG